MAKPRPFVALQVANYRRFVAGQAISLVGSWTETIAQGVLILSLTHSPVVLGVAAATRYIPVLLVAPYAGVIVDRHDRRRTLITTQCLLGALSLVFGVTVLAGVVAMWQIYTVAVLFGLLTAFDNPARMALIPEIVGPNALRNAITLNSTLANVGRGVGPVVAASLIASVGVGWCFVTNAISFAFVVVALVSMNAAEMHPEGIAGRHPGQLRAALTIVRGDPNILGPLAIMAVVGTLTYEFEVSFPVFSEGSLAGGATEYALLTAAFGAGAVLAGIVLIYFPQTGLRRMIMITVGYGLVLGVTAISPTDLMANVAVVFVGSASIGFLTTGNSTIQLAAPPQMRGRITSLWTMAFTGSTPIGALIIGAIGQWLGGRATIFVAAGACLAAAALGTGILRSHPSAGAATCTESAVSRGPTQT